MYQDALVVVDEVAVAGKRSWCNILCDLYDDTKMNDPNFANTDMSGYGFMWYDYNEMKIAMGFLGQQLVISKKNNVVAARLLQSRWENPTFEDATTKNDIYFNNFKNLIETI